MIRIRHPFLSSLLVAGAAFATPGEAAIIVDTGAVANVGGRPLNEAQALAGLFTLSASETIASVEGMIGGTAATGTIAIFNGGVDPASSSLLFSASFAIADSRLTSYQGVFGQNWTLAAGSYWVGFFTDGTNFMAFPATNLLSRHAVRGFDNLWAQQGSALALGIRIADATPAVEPPGPGAVPEPTTWAMMLIGFGAIGSAMRRQVEKVRYA
jgi:PEP-CTERM motif